MEQYFNAKGRKIRAIVFDFDETLYVSPNTRKLYIQYIKNTVMTLGGHSESASKALMEKLGFTESNKASPSFRASCEHFGITKQQWDEYRMDNFFEIDYENAHTVSLATLKRLKKTYPLFIASNEVKENVLKKAVKLNIDLSIFDDMSFDFVVKSNTLMVLSFEISFTESETSVLIGIKFFYHCKKT